MLCTLALRTLAMSVALIVIDTSLFADEPLTADTQIEFASLEAGRTLVSTRDTFIGALSRFDRQVRLQTDGEATEDVLFEFLAREVVAWDDASTGNDPAEATTRTLITQSLARLRPKLSEAVTHSLKPRSFCGSDRVARPAWTPRRPLIESPKAKDIFDQFGAVGLYDETHIIVERHFQEKLKALPSKLQTIFSSTVKSIADHPPTVN